MSGTDRRCRRPLHSIALRYIPAGEEPAHWGDWTTNDSGAIHTARPRGRMSRAGLRTVTTTVKARCRWPRASFDPAAATASPARLSAYPEPTGGAGRGPQGAAPVASASVPVPVPASLRTHPSNLLFRTGKNRIRSKPMPGCRRPNRTRVLSGNTEASGLPGQPALPGASGSASAAARSFRVSTGNGACRYEIGSGGFRVCPRRKQSPPRKRHTAKQTK